MSAPRRYGLILPKSKQASSVSRPSLSSNVFGDDSDDEHSKSNIEDMIRKESTRNLSKVNTQLMMKKALDEDANVFEYDGVYDEMKTKKEEQDLANKVITKDRKPKYIDNLLKNAATRKKEDERRQQRKIQKEREDEKEEFGDKESFVTSAYKKKLEEMQREEEEAKRKEQLEEMMDVTKQKDLSGFYRHLLKQQCGEEKLPVSSTATVKEEPVEQKPSSSKKTDFKTKSTNLDSDSEFEKSSSDEEDTDVNLKKTVLRTYRKRKQQSESEDEVAMESQPHPDADESLNESSSESETDNEEVSKEKQKSNKEQNIVKDTEETQIKKRQPIDWKVMFITRCTGERFELARKRYLERKAARAGISVQ